jgi:hypothetical protein
MDTIFTVRNQDLERLSAQEAVDFFRELLWAEATSLGIGKTLSTSRVRLPLSMVECVLFGSRN